MVPLVIMPLEGEVERPSARPSATLEVYQPKGERPLPLPLYFLVPFFQEHTREGMVAKVSLLKFPSSHITTRQVLVAKVSPNRNIFT